MVQQLRDVGITWEETEGVAATAAPGVEGVAGQTFVLTGTLPTLTRDAAKELIETGIPTFGICLGHQIMALASGAKTYKMPFGHHGGNHPVKDLDNGRVSITSQNHGFAVDTKTLPANLRATHISLFDGTLQGLARTDKPAFCFQGHPEASPGPHDISYLFDRFVALMEKKNA